MKIVPCLFLLHSQHTRATPIAQGVAPCGFIDEIVTYTITDQHEVEGEPNQLAFSCTPQGGDDACMLFWLDPKKKKKPLFPDHADVTSACTLSRSQQFEVSLTIEVGANLGLEFEKIGSVGLSTSVSYTRTEGHADAAEVTCDGNHTCALVVIPKMLEVSGKKTTRTLSCEPHEEVGDYTVRYPIMVDESPKANFQACACKNKIGWADEGAPPPCPNDC